MYKLGVFIVYRFLFSCFDPLEIKLDCLWLLNWKWTQTWEQHRVFVHRFAYVVRLSCKRAFIDLQVVALYQDAISWQQIPLTRNHRNKSTFVSHGSLDIHESIVSKGVNELSIWHVALPYLTWAKSPTTMSATGIWMTFPFRTTVNFCSCSIRLCRPRNCFSLDQSLNAVTKTTQTTDNRMAAPSIQPVSPSPSSSAPPAPFPQPAGTRRGWLAGLWHEVRTESCHSFDKLSQVICSLWENLMLL